MGPSATLVLPDGEASGAGGRLGYDQMSRAVAGHTASSKEGLMVRLCTSLWLSQLYMLPCTAARRGLVVQSSTVRP